MNSKHEKHYPTTALFALAVFAGYLIGASAAADEVDARIRHRPVQSAPSGMRLELVANIRDKAGVDLARIYFKAERETNYLFVPMRLAIDGDYYATLPAPSRGVGAVEYLILVRNLDEAVYKTQVYAIDIEDGDIVMPTDSEPVQVFTELAELPNTVQGFTDNIALDVAESAAKYGVVAGLTSEAGAGTAAASVSATGGTTVAASAGLSTVATVGIGAAVAAAVGGVVVATQEDDKNRAPEFLGGPLTLSVPESTTGPIGDPVVATDPDGDSLTYSLGGADAGAFEVDATSGQLRVGASTELDFEARTSYTFEVVASDGELTATRTVSLSVSDVNEGPTFPDGDLTLSVPEGTTGPIGDPVVATDPDGDSLTYSLAGADAGAFEVDTTSGQLRVGASTELDFEARTSYQFEVVASDGDLTVTRSLSLSVSDVNEDPTFANGDLTLSVPEGTTGPIGDPVVATDPDGDSLTYSLGGADAGAFQIDATGQLSARDNLNVGTYTFDVVATDPGGLAASRAIVVTVNRNFIGDFDIFTDREDPRIQVCVRDHGWEDGDLLTVKLNGEAVFTNVVISNDWNCRDGLSVNPGPNIIEVYAHNTGSAWPNTGAIRVTGTNSATKEWELDKGETGIANVNILLDDMELASDDWRALVTLYNSTNGANWLRNDNWSPSLDTVPTVAELASWYGVTVSNGRVTRLDLPENNLTGPIPPELGGLTNLEELYLRSNSLTGLIPPELGGLTNLEALWLYGNSLTGPIPPELGGLTNLEELYLRSNSLTGLIPPELGGLTNLEALWLYGNSLTGPIPPELGGLTNLEALWLYDNSLTGPIPPELGGLTNLEYLYLHDNSLTGPLPSNLTNLTALSQFDWGSQSVADTETPLCAPTDAAFQEWLTTIYSTWGPNCADTGASVAGVSAPRVEAVSIVSDPGPDGVYGAGEVVEAAVRFDRPVTIAGVPQLRLGVGSATVPADLVHAQGEAKTLFFRYTVALGDADADGVSVGVDALRLNGGSIAGADGGTAAVGLGAHAIRDDAEQLSTLALRSRKGRSWKTRWRPRSRRIWPAPLG